MTLSFSLIDLENAPKNRFRYQLLGIDKKRIEAGTAHSVTYSQLPSGSYTFQLTGSADGSQWSTPVELKITVNPPLYRTWWAYLGYIVVLSLIAVSYTHLDVYKRQPQQFKHYFKGRSVWSGLEDTHGRWVINNFKAFYFTTNTETQSLSPLPTFRDVHAMVEDGKGGFWQLQNDAVSFSRMTLRPVSSTHLDVYKRQVWILGHSMGGFQVLNYGIHHSNRLNGIIALSPLAGRDSLYEAEFTKMVMKRKGQPFFEKGSKIFMGKDTTRYGTTRCV